MDIEEKITKIEVNIATMIATHREQHKKHNELNENVLQMLNKHNDSIYGPNGSNMKIDRLEQSEKKRAWHFRTIWGGLVAMTLKVFYDMFGRE